jgi:putative ABC transport system substrate-binding protein
MRPDIFVAGNTQMAQLIQAETRSIPIVFVTGSDPVGNGLIEGFAHPGGNITGFTNFDQSVGGKWVELLRDVTPKLQHIGVILHEGNLSGTGYLKTIEDGASTFAIRVDAVSLADRGAIDSAVAAFAREPAGGLIVPPSALAVAFSSRIIELTERYRLPAIYPYSQYPDAGGLMSYGLNITLLWQEAASYVDRILRGQKPNDLPVQTPTKFELVVNLKTAKVLDLAISEPFLLAADRVIE